MNLTYVIGHLSVKDENKWNEYRSQVPSTLQPWGAELVFRGSLSQVLSGDHSDTNTVIIKFPGMEAVRGWYSSEAYQRLIPLREQAATMTLLVYE